MAVTTTIRLALTRWSAGTDPFTRAQMDGSFASLEDKVAMDAQGTLASRPAAVAANKGLYYHATDAQKLYRSDGAIWHFVIDMYKERGFTRQFLASGGST